MGLGEFCAQRLFEKPYCLIQVLYKDMNVIGLFYFRFFCLPS